LTGAEAGAADAGADEAGAAEAGAAETGVAAGLGDSVLLQETDHSARGATTKSVKVCFMNTPS
jgi:hypothetical protein